MNNEQLAIHIKNNPDDTQAKGELYSNLFYWIKAFINKEFAHERDKEDLLQESYFAMLKAASGYDPEQGKFTTYFTWKLKCHLQRYVANNASSTSVIRMPIHQGDNLNRYNRAVSRFEQEHGREPTMKEIAEILDISIKSAESIRDCAKRAHTSSIDESSDDLSMHNILPDKVNIEYDIIEQVAKEHLKRDIWDCVDRLSDSRQSIILRCFYQEGQTLEEISSIINYSVSRTKELKTDALLRLRNSKRVRDKLLPYVNFQVIRSSAIRGTGVSVFKRTWTSATERAAIY